MAKLQGVVDDSLRERESSMDEAERLLLDSKTVYLTEMTNSELSVWYSRFMSRHGRKLKRRLKNRGDETQGYYVWLDPAESNGSS